MPEDSKQEADQQIILELCRQQPEVPHALQQPPVAIKKWCSARCLQGVAETEVISKFPDAKQAILPLNSLLKAHRLVTLTGRDGTRYYKSVEAEEASKCAAALVRSSPC